MPLISSEPMQPIYSRTIPCKRCGAKGETLQTVAGWFCQKCIDELLDEPRTLGKHKNRKAEDQKDE